MKHEKHTAAQASGKPLSHINEGLSATVGRNPVKQETAETKLCIGLMAEQARSLAASGFSNRMPHTAYGGVAAVVAVTGSNR